MIDFSQMEARPVPYAPDTRARGWRFELDMERVLQSDTWDLAGEIPMAQAALLMMWTAAWSQTPCGSMPADADLIRAKLRIPRDLWADVRDIVLRGWWLAEDGRLYHSTIVERVHEMMAVKDRERARKQAWRARKLVPAVDAPTAVPAEVPAADAAAEAAAPDLDVPDAPRLSRGTDVGQTWDGRGTDDTGTGTGSGSIGTPPFVAKDGMLSLSARESDQKPIEPAPGVGPPSPGWVCKAMRSAGLQATNPGDSRLLELLRAGVDAATLVDGAIEAVNRGKGWGYALKVAESRHAEVLAMRQGRPPLRVGAGAPPGPESFAARDRRAAMERWERMTGRVHPDRAAAPPPSAVVIDIAPAVEMRRMAR